MATRESSAANWNRGVHSHTIGYTKAMPETRKVKSRAKAKRAKSSRKGNR